MSQSIHAVCPHCSAVNRIPADRPASEAKCGACKANLFTGEPIALTPRPSTSTSSATICR